MGAIFAFSWENFKWKPKIEMIRKCPSCIWTLPLQVHMIHYSHLSCTFMHFCHLCGILDHNSLKMYKFKYFSPFSCALLMFGINRKLIKQAFWLARCYPSWPITAIIRLKQKAFPKWEMYQKHFLIGKHFRNISRLGNAGSKCFPNGKFDLTD